MGRLDFLIIFICFFVCLSFAVLIFLIFFLSKKFKNKQRDEAEALNEVPSDAEPSYEEDQQRQSTEAEDNNSWGADGESGIHEDLYYPLQDCGYSHEQILALANMQYHDPELTADRLRMIFKPSMAADEIKEKIRLFYGDERGESDNE